MLNRTMETKWILNFLCDLKAGELKKMVLTPAFTDRAVSRTHLASSSVVMFLQRQCVYLMPTEFQKRGNQKFVLVQSFFTDEPHEFSPLRSFVCVH